MKALTVDFDLIAQCMKDIARESSDYYLDKGSGRVLTLSRSLLRSLASEGVDDRPAIAEWDAPMIPIARDIVLMGSAQYLRIPEAFGLPEHKWMLEFARQRHSFRLKQKLILTLRGRGACRRFKAILKDSPEDMQAWGSYCTLRWEQQIQRWLESISILAVNEKPRLRFAS